MENVMMNCNYIPLADTTFMMMSGTGEATLKQWEGLRLQPYKDGNGWSIAYGHQIRPNELWMMAGITQQQAEDIFQTDLMAAEIAVSDTLTEPFRAGKGISNELYDGLIMFAYNIGWDNFRSSQLARLVNSGASDQEIYDFWLRTWVGDPAKQILLDRRKKEASYAFPNISGSGSNWLWLIAGYLVYKQLT